MPHQTTITRVRAFWGCTLYRVACTCAGLYFETSSRHLAGFVADGHQGGVL